MKAYKFSIRITGLTGKLVFKRDSNQDLDKVLAIANREAKKYLRVCTVTVRYNESGYVRRWEAN